MQPKDFASKKAMKREKLFKYLSIGLFALITAILMVATIMEKFHGTEYALQNIYCADWMIALWTAATLSGIVYILQRKMQRLCLHMAFVVILLGALVTHTTGKQGQIHMRIGDYTNKYTLDDGSVEKLPFSLSLHSFKVTRYAGSEAPMDFVSGIVVYDDERIEGTVSMNNIFKHKGYRFYQSGYDDDEKGTFLSISYDPWGIGITYAGYLIFVAEVASTCNEALLMHYLLENTTDEKDRKYLINHQLESFRGTLFRQTMFAEFEKIVHGKMAAGESLTKDDLCKIYHDLNVLYYGPDIVVDEEIDYEWMRIPHFYTSFYVYQYATGYSAAIAFSKKILEEGAPAVERYIDKFLSAGGSKDPIDILKDAGVDMSTPVPVDDALNVFESYLEMFEQMV